MVHFPLVGIIKPNPHNVLQGTHTLNISPNNTVPILVQVVITRPLVDLCTTNILILNNTVINNLVLLHYDNDTIKC